MKTYEWKFSSRKYKKKTQSIENKCEHFACTHTQLNLIEPLFQLYVHFDFSTRFHGSFIGLKCCLFLLQAWFNFIVYLFLSIFQFLWNGKFGARKHIGMFSLIWSFLFLSTCLFVCFSVPLCVCVCACARGTNWNLREIPEYFTDRHQQ